MQKKVWKKKKGFRGNVLNVQAAVTYRFLEAVLTEVVELFPGRFVHVGMDEIPKEAWTTNPQKEDSGKLKLQLA